MLASLVQGGGGKQVLTVTLDPASLGQVQVRIDSESGAAPVVSITAQRPETLALLQQDQSSLQHALDTAGVATGGRTLVFHLAEQPVPAAAAAIPAIAASAAGAAAAAGHAAAPALEAAPVALPDPQPAPAALAAAQGGEQSQAQTSGNAPGDTAGQPPPQQHPSPDARADTPGDTPADTPANTHGGTAFGASIGDAAMGGAGQEAARQFAAARSGNAGIAASDDGDDIAVGVPPPPVRWLRAGLDITA